MFINNVLFGPLRSRYSAMTVFGIHFLVCLIILIIGGLIVQGGLPTGTFAAADVFRYLGYLMSLLLAIIFGICLIVLRGGLCFTYLWFAEIPACAFQLLAWIFDAVDATKLEGTSGSSYGLAVTSALFGAFASIFTLLIAIGLSKKRIGLATMCGGEKDCCGVNTDNDVKAGEQPAHHDGNIKTDSTTANPPAGHTGKESV